MPFIDLMFVGLKSYEGSSSFKIAVKFFEVLELGNSKIVGFEDGSAKSGDVGMDAWVEQDGI